MRKQIDWYKWWDDFSSFTSKQKQAERAVDESDYVLYGGAAGGGKSYFLRKYPIKFLIENCWHKLKLRGVRVGLFCEDYPTLWDRHLNRIPYEFPKYLGEYRAQHNEFVLHPHLGGGVIAFRNLDDPSKYMSSEFALVAVDELTKNKRDVFDFLRLRKRWSGVSRTKFIGGTNPGDIGHEWVKALWLERKFDPNEKEADQYVFVPASATDNPHLDKSYYVALDSLPDALRKAYKEGNWDTFAGQYFQEWDKQVHVIAPFTIPSTWRRFRSYDHGRKAPACCSWYALDHDGRLYKYRELYKDGLNINELAVEINRLSEGETYEWSVADPSIFANHGFVDAFGGQTIAEGFARHGIIFYPASNRRIDGWNLMHQYLKWSDGIPPKLVYFNTCYNSIRTIPNLIHSELKPEDMDSDGEDHAADTDRYMLMSLHEQKSQNPLNEVQRKLAQLQDRNNIQKQLTDFYYNI